MCQVYNKSYFKESNVILSTCVELLPLLAKMQNIVRGKHIFSHFMFPFTRLFQRGKHISRVYQQLYGSNIYQES